MTKLTKQEIEHIAKLAFLDLPEEKKEKFNSQIAEILDFVDGISVVNTENTETEGNITGEKNVFREDIIEPSFSQEEALKNAPVKHKGYFKVKAIFK